MWVKIKSSQPHVAKSHQQSEISIKALLSILSVMQRTFSGHFSSNQFSDLVHHVVTKTPAGTMEGMSATKTQRRTEDRIAFLMTNQSQNLRHFKTKRLSKPSSKIGISAHNSHKKPKIRRYLTHSEILFLPIFQKLQLLLHQVYTLFTFLSLQL